MKKVVFQWPCGTAALRRDLPRNHAGAELTQDAHFAERMRDARTTLLLEAPVTRMLLHLAIPNLVMMLMQFSVGLIETYLFAKLGTDALAGLSLVFPLLMMVQMISAGAMGGGINGHF